MGSPQQEANHDDEPGAVSSWTFHGRSWSGTAAMRGAKRRPGFALCGLTLPTGSVPAPANDASSMTDLISDNLPQAQLVSYTTHPRFSYSPS
jgi:hypothetical protein